MRHATLSLLLLVSVIECALSFHMMTRTRHVLYSSVNRHLIMQQRSSGGGGKGGTQLDNRTKQKTSTKPTFKEEIEKDWRLILHDDTVHTIQEVCEIIGACCPLCPPAKAYECTLETHMTGAGTVAVSNKKIIDEYTKALQVAGLTVSMAPDDEFEGGDGDGGDGFDE